MKKIFIDGGAHSGESVDLFRSLYQDAGEYEIHCFEPNPAMWPLLEKKGVTLHKEAIWKEDGEKNFYIGKFSEGSTLMEKKVSGKVNYREPIKTRCVRLSRWLRENTSKEDYVFLKLDIEGAEYDVLDDMIDTGAFDNIDYLCGELHLTGKNGKIRSLGENRKEQILKRLDDIGVVFNDWNNNHLNV